MIRPGKWTRVPMDFGFFNSGNSFCIFLKIRRVKCTKNWALREDLVESAGNCT